MFVYLSLPCDIICLTVSCLFAFLSQPDQTNDGLQLEAGAEAELVSVAAEGSHRPGAGPHDPQPVVCLPGVLSSADLLTRRRSPPACIGRPQASRCLPVTPQPTTRGMAAMLTILPRPVLPQEAALTDIRDASVFVEFYMKGSYLSLYKRSKDSVPETLLSLYSRDLYLLQHSGTSSYFCDQHVQFF